jgi:CHAT domain-containing protein
MKTLYTNYFGGKTIDVAFKDTQLAMRKQYPDEPYKWAAFVLVR